MKLIDRISIGRLCQHDGELTEGNDNEEDKLLPKGHVEGIPRIRRRSRNEDNGTICQLDRADSGYISVGLRLVELGIFDCLDTILILCE